MAARIAASVKVRWVYESGMLSGAVSPCRIRSVNPEGPPDCAALKEETSDIMPDVTPWIMMLGFVILDAIATYRARDHDDVT